MAIIDCAQTIEPHWKWDCTPFVSQSYTRGDEFQEFGLKWYGFGFSTVTAPGWKIKDGQTLDQVPMDWFIGVATVLDLSDVNGAITKDALLARLEGTSPRNLIVLKTGHADRTGSRHVAYWKQAPQITPDCARIIADAGYKHIAVDFPCDSVPARRPDGEGAIHNFNETFRQMVHAQGMLLTENCENLSAIEQDEVFFVSLPIAMPPTGSAPCRPIALTEWKADSPKLTDVSTPFVNHWRWKLELWTGRSFAKGDDREEQHFVLGGHGYTHCDAPCHMYREGATIQKMPNNGLDVFIGDAHVVDFTDLNLPQAITKEMMVERASKVKPGEHIILHSDLTNTLGYPSREWHLKAPNIEEDAAEWLAEHGVSAVCLDFPQDYVARQMPYRHVKNEEFVAHHAIFRKGIPFIEDLRDLGTLTTKTPFLLAVPLKMTCVDGAPMRVVAVDW